MAKTHTESHPAKLTPGRVAALTDDTFEMEVYASPVPVLVDFHADWCGPCGPMAAVAADLAREFSGRLAVATVDVDASPDVTRHHGVMSMPTFALFVGGVEKARLVGARPKRAVLAAITPFLS